MFERYTEEARRVVAVAQEEARALRHNHVGTEHLLLGLLRLPQETVVGRVLAALELSSEGARARLRDLVPSGEDAGSSQLPFTPRAKKVLELSLREALSRGDRDIGPEHLLLGIAHDEDTMAARLLSEHGVTTAQLREMLGVSLPPPKPGRLAGRRRNRVATAERRHIDVEVSADADRLLMSAAARALDDGRTLITIADIEEALRRHHDADDPPPQTATG